MKVGIVKDEWYPFYHIRGTSKKDLAESDAVIKNVHPKRLAKWRRVLAELDKVQSEIGEAVE